MKTIALRGFYTLMISPLSIAPAFAHEGSAALHGFTAGFSHPWLGLDHLLVLTAVGLLSQSLSEKRSSRLFMAFIGLMCIEACIPVSESLTIVAEFGMVLSVLMSAYLLANQPTFTSNWSMVLVALFALCHGHSHARVVLNSDQLTQAFALSGLVLATLSLLTIGYLLCRLKNEYRTFVQANLAGFCMMAGLLLLIG